MRILCYLIILFFTLRVFGAEGLFPTSAKSPNVIRFVDPKVFIVLISTPQEFYHGTSIFVQIKNMGPQTELYFLSNNHVLKNHCPETGLCQNLYILQNPQLLYTDKQGLSLENAKETVKFPQVEVVRRSKELDLVLLRVIVPSNTLPKGLRVLEVPVICPTPQFGETLFSVGFSDPTMRPQPSNLTLLPQANYILKRWSYGYFISREDHHQIKYYEGTVLKTEMATLLKTTVDALGGGSGGPVVNARGDLVGMMMAVAKDGQTSLTIPCSTLKTFLSESPEAAH